MQRNLLHSLALIAQDYTQVLTQWMFKWWRILWKRAMRGSMPWITKRPFSCKTWSCWLTCTPCRTFWPSSLDLSLARKRLSTRFSRRYRTKRTSPSQEGCISEQKCLLSFRIMVPRLALYWQCWQSSESVSSNSANLARKSRLSRSNLMEWWWASRNYYKSFTKSNSFSIWLSSRRNTPAWRPRELEAV